MRRQLLAKLSFIALLNLSLLGCGGGGAGGMFSSETAVELTIISAKDLNPDRDGRPSPVIIKVFALSDERQFKREDFLSLYENPAERLGSDLLDSFQLKEFSPEETRTETLLLSPETRFIGLMAEYQQYDRAEALLTLPIKTNKKSKFTIKAERLRIISAEQ
ncbi:type VI secretion system-associated lipoprotein [Gammaproteobacteria bacterium 53_120_T64]|nr:type VI secretion system-associated lipoprotein [Gammaproteobacteria bacterium 53_120_T64]